MCHELEGPSNSVFNQREYCVENGKEGLSQGEEDVEDGRDEFRGGGYDGRHFIIWYSGLAGYYYALKWVVGVLVVLIWFSEERTGRVRFYIGRSGTTDVIALVGTYTPLSSCLRLLAIQR